jgi:hypothetical protein
VTDWGIPSASDARLPILGKPIEVKTIYFGT